MGRRILPSTRSSREWLATEELDVESDEAVEPIDQPDDAMAHVDGWAPGVSRRQPLARLGDVWRLDAQRASR